jgi:hypothetical protein
LDKKTGRHRATPQHHNIVSNTVGHVIVHMAVRATFRYYLSGHGQI